MPWICLECSLSLSSVGLNSHRLSLLSAFSTGCRLALGNLSLSPGPLKSSPMAVNKVQQGKWPLPDIPVFQNLLSPSLHLKYECRCQPRSSQAVVLAPLFPHDSERSRSKNEVFSSRAPLHHPIRVIPTVSQHLIRAFLSQTAKAPRLLYEKWFHGEAVWN